MKGLLSIVALLVVSAFASAQTPACATCTDGTCKTAPGVGLLGATANTFQRTAQFVQGTVGRASCSSCSSCSSATATTTVRTSVVTRSGSGPIRNLLSRIRGGCGGCR